MFDHLQQSNESCPWHYVLSFSIVFAPPSSSSLSFLSFQIITKSLLPRRQQSLGGISSMHSNLLLLPFFIAGYSAMPTDAPHPSVASSTATISSLLLPSASNAPGSRSSTYKPRLGLSHRPESTRGGRDEYYPFRPSIPDDGLINTYAVMNLCGDAWQEVQKRATIIQGEAANSELFPLGPRLVAHDFLLIGD